jgi:hypothetical protein
MPQTWTVNKDVGVLDGVVPKGGEEPDEVVAERVRKLHNVGALADNIFPDSAAGGRMLTLLLRGALAPLEGLELAPGIPVVTGDVKKVDVRPRARRHTPLLV